MSGTYSKGVPYPDATDPVANGDDSIRNLAKWVNDNIGRVQNGNGTVNIVASGTTASVDVTFPVAFIAAPNVVVSINNTVHSPGAISLWLSNITTTGFRVNAQRTGTAAVPFNWIATN